jgi:hypothetical protein
LPGRERRKKRKKVEENQHGQEEEEIRQTTREAEAHLFLGWAAYPVSLCLSVEGNKGLDASANSCPVKPSCLSK